jgi:hypothetical protein
MVAKRHKITNVPLFKKIVPRKKIMSRIFLNSGTLTLMSLAEARYCLAIFSGLILKNLFSVKNLRVQLFLPWVLKIRLHPLFPSKKNSKCIILSFYQNWCEKARSKLCYPRPNMCQTHGKKARSFIFPGTEVLASPF